MNRRRPNHLLVWIGSIAVSAFAVVGGYFIGRVSDCRPGQIDRQCGLSTFYWYVVVAAFQRRRKTGCRVPHVSILRRGM